jgi:transcriptional regulator with XRE-family HTH domain
VSRSYLSQLEKAAFYASLKIVQRLATALNVSATELLATPEEGPREEKVRGLRPSGAASGQDDSTRPLGIASARARALQ